MFEYFGTNLNIGQRNAEKIRSILAKEKIRLVAEDVGGRAGRSVTFLPSDGGKVLVRVANGTSQEI